MSRAADLQVTKTTGEQEAFDERKARWVQLRHLAGLSTAEIATLDDTSQRTVRRELQIGRARLRREIEARS